MISLISCWRQGRQDGIATLFLNQSGMFLFFLFTGWFHFLILRLPDCSYFYIGSGEKRMDTNLRMKRKMEKTGNRTAIF